MFEDRENLPLSRGFLITLQRTRGLIPDQLNVFETDFRTGIFEFLTSGRRGTAVCGICADGGNWWSLKLPGSIQTYCSTMEDEKPNHNRLRGEIHSQKPNWPQRTRLEKVVITSQHPSRCVPEPAYLHQLNASSLSKFISCWDFNRLIVVRGSSSVASIRYFQKVSLLSPGVSYETFRIDHELIRGISE